MACVGSGRTSVTQPRARRTERTCVLLMLLSSNNSSSCWFATERHAWQQVGARGKSYSSTCCQSHTSKKLVNIEPHSNIWFGMAYIESACRLGTTFLEILNFRANSSKIALNHRFSCLTKLNNYRSYGMQSWENDFESNAWPRHVTSTIRQFINATFLNQLSMCTLSLGWRYPSIPQGWGYMASAMCIPFVFSTLAWPTHFSLLLLLLFAWNPSASKVGCIHFKHEVACYLMHGASCCGWMLGATCSAHGMQVQTGCNS